MRPNVNLSTRGTPSGSAAGFGYAILCYAAFGWTSTGGIVWEIDSTIARAVVIGLQAAGWILLVAASHEIDHYETFGFKHPIQTGIFVGMWAS